MQLGEIENYASNLGADVKAQEGKCERLQIATKGLLQHLRDIRWKYEASKEISESRHIIQTAVEDEIGDMDHV